MQYFTNLKLWAVGFTKLDTIPLKPGWTPFTFGLLYATDYLLAVLLGRGVQSLSRAFELFGKSHHWGQTGPILWGSVDLWR